MSDVQNKVISVPRIECLRVKNFRALKHIVLQNIQPLSVFLGPNGSGKSTILDVLAFLSECFSSGLRKAWDTRGRFKELHTRGSHGPLELELKYREHHDDPAITYHISIEEDPRGPFISEEWLQWRGTSQGKTFRFLHFKNGQGTVVSGENPDEHDQRIEEKLDSREIPAATTLGQFVKYPRVSTLRRFITDWYLSPITSDTTRGLPEAGPQERLSVSGDNLPNVIQFLKEQHPDRLNRILSALSMRIPGLAGVKTEILADGRLLLQLKDAFFEKPILSRFASDGTLKMLAYLTILYDPEPPGLIAIEEPENHFHPRLLAELSEECLQASEIMQLVLTSHSPYFVNELSPEEVWILFRNTEGYTQAVKASEIRGIRELIEEGGKLGQLWAEGHFGVGDPLAPDQIVSPYDKDVKKKRGGA